MKGVIKSTFDCCLNLLQEGVGVRPTQLIVYAIITKCPNHALHPMNG